MVDKVWPELISELHLPPLVIANFDTTGTEMKVYQGAEVQYSLESTFNMNSTDSNNYVMCPNHPVNAGHLLRSKIIKDQHELEPECENSKFICMSEGFKAKTPNSAFMSKSNEYQTNSSLTTVSKNNNKNIMLFP